MSFRSVKKEINKIKKGFFPLIFSNMPPPPQLTKYLGFNIIQNNTAAKNVVTLFLAGIFIAVLNLICSLVGDTPNDAVNQNAGKLPSWAGLIAIGTLVLTLLLCLAGPIYCACKGLAGNYQMLQAFAACQGTIAFCSILGLVFMIIASAGVSGYTYYCTKECMKQLDAGNATCTTVGASPQGGFGGGASGRSQINIVSKEYCESKGTVYQGSWYNETVGPMFAIVSLFVTLALFYFIIKTMPAIKAANAVGAVTNGVVMMPQITTGVVIVSSPVIIQQPQPMVSQVQQVVVLK